MFRLRQFSRCHACSFFTRVLRVCTRVSAEACKATIEKQGADRESDFIRLGKIWIGVRILFYQIEENLDMHVIRQDNPNLW